MLSDVRWLQISDTYDPLPVSTPQRREFEAGDLSSVFLQLLEFFLALSLFSIPLYNSASKRKVLGNREFLIISEVPRRRTHNFAAAGC